MKRILLLTAIAAIALTACQKAETTISFNITDLPEGTVIEILKWEEDVGETFFDSAAVNGTFCYTYTCGSNSAGAIYGVSSRNGNNHLGSGRDIYVKSGYNTTVTGSGFYAENWTVESENPRQQFSNKFNDATKDIKIEYERLHSEAIDNGGPELIEKYNEAQAKYNEACWTAMETLPVDEYWLEAFADATDIINDEGTDWPTYPRMTEIYKRLSDADKATPAGKQITKNLFGGEKAAE
ncbi:MAG: hypothetical protein J6W13_05030 [Salinivirgaceae bacterium]|nr:hypothetical protein [Salinivirgaceae bacterium]